MAIVDHGPLGGLCILRGCMPTKAMLRSSEVAALLRRATTFGLSETPIRADLSAIVDRKDRLVREFADYRIRQLRDPRLTLYEAKATFRSPHEIAVDGAIITGRFFILATGSRPNEITLPGISESGFHTSDTILDLRRQPASMVVLGGGPVAVELGQFFARIGTRVTILQRGRTLLSDLDADVGLAIEAALAEEGIEVVTGVEILRAEPVGREKLVWIKQTGQARPVAGEEILHALGRRPNIDDLGLREAGVAVQEGRIKIDGAMRTSQLHIFAVGDVNDLNPIVHIAIQQGEIAGYNATHPDKPSMMFDPRLNTEVVFTEPQVAVVGLSERACRAQGVPYLSSSYPFADHGKSLCRGDLHGFVKLLAAPESGRVLGAQIVGPEAGELIHELIAVMHFHGTVTDLLRMPHYHPTLAEIVTFPAEALAGQVRPR